MKKNAEFKGNGIKLGTEPIPEMNEVPFVGNINDIDGLIGEQVEFVFSNISGANQLLIISNKSFVGIAYEKKLTPSYTVSGNGKWTQW